MLIKDVYSIIIFKILFNKDNISISRPLKALQYLFLLFSFIYLNNIELRRMTGLNNNSYRPC